MKSYSKGIIKFELLTRDWRIKLWRQSTEIFHSKCVSEIIVLKRLSQNLHKYILV
jgi:hypothetical protein